MRVTKFFLAILVVAGINANATEPIVEVFVGSTPTSAVVTKFFDLPAGAEASVQWELTLIGKTDPGAASRYHLRGKYSSKHDFTPKNAFEKTGQWKENPGAKSQPSATVRTLDGTLSFVRVSDDLLQLLNADGKLMVGDGGFSFTLNRTNVAEIPQPPPPSNAESISYRIDPMASGPAVFGVFEGRTPCVGIARALNLPLDAHHRMKAKWRVTLWQDPETRKPTTYKVEGTFYRRGVRTGKWSIENGTPSDPNAVVYQLAPFNGHAPLRLLKGDDNVLFFLDQNEKPLVGHVEFSYTLNRREPSQQASVSSAR